MNYQFDFGAVWAAWPLLLTGFINAVYYTVVSSILALVLGIVVMVLRRSANSVVRAGAKSFIEIIRNTPFLVQLFFIYFGLPSIGFKFSVSGAAIAALTVNTAAYIAETLRGGVDSLSKGQFEAGRALGMKGRHVFFDIVLKPALRSVYPSLSSQFVLLMLTTSVLASISAEELTYTAQRIESQSFRSFETYLIVTAIYLAMSIAMSSGLKLAGRVYFAYPTK
jgi:polar amino acid transport system permease protein